MKTWNVYHQGRKLNSYPLNEEQALKMAHLMRINYKRAGAKAIGGNPVTDDKKSTY